MNYLVVNYEYPPIGGGAATASRHLAMALRDMGHGVTVLSTAFGDQKGWADEDGIRVFRCRAVRKSSFQSNPLEMTAFMASAGLAMHSICRKQRIEVILAFFLIPGGPLGLQAKLLGGIPYMVLLRGGDVPGTEPSLDRINRVLTPLRRTIYRQSRAVVANSEQLKTLAQTWDPVPVAVIPNGVDTDYFQPMADKPDPNRLLAVGRFQSQKNFFFLLEQTARLRKTSATPFELHIVGDGPQKEALRARAADLGINDIVCWHPWQPRERMRHLYQQARCLVNTSHYEGMSNVILEAMACGLPVVASDVAGNDALVDQGKTGLRYPPGHGDAFGSAVDLMLGDTVLAETLGRCGRQRVMDRFSWARSAESIHERMAGKKSDGTDSP